MINMERTGARISKLRKDQGMTQAELAARLMVSPQAVSKWETGQALPDSGQLLAMSHLFDVTINSILAGEAPAASPARPSTPPPPATPPNYDADDADGTDDADDSNDAGEEECGEPNPRPGMLETITGLAPFIDSDTLGQLLKDCDWTGAEVSHLESVIAFLSSDVVDELIDRVPPPSAAEIARLAPFLGSAKLASLLEDVEDEITLELLRQVSAFLPPQTCSRLFMRLLSESGDHSFETLAAFAPFINAEALEALVRAVPPPNLEGLRRIAPFLDEERVGHLLRELLNRGT
ncbi:MAG: helix-turn-helix domain-containing protein [Bacillota bacterium]